MFKSTAMKRTGGAAKVISGASVTAISKKAKDAEANANAGQSANPLIVIRRLISSKNINPCITDI